MEDGGAPAQLQAAMRRFANGKQRRRLATCEGRDDVSGGRCGDRTRRRRRGLPREDGGDAALRRGEPGDARRWRPAGKRGGGTFGQPLSPPRRARPWRLTEVAVEPTTHPKEGGRVTPAVPAVGRGEYHDRHQWPRGGNVTRRRWPRLADVKHYLGEEGICIVGHSQVRS
jgi:hypothetical protein